MHKEQAIDLLDNLIGMVEDNQDNDYDTALRMAIDALKAQLFSEGATSDLISKTEIVERLRNAVEITYPSTDYEGGYIDGIEFAISTVSTMPTIQPVATDINIGDKITKFIDGLEVIFADLRERHVDDSVCGLCEYDGAYMGQSGDWCNECPGFEKDDCFKLSDKTRKKWTDEIIKALSTIQPEERTEKRMETHGVCLDAISRQAAIDALDCINGVEEVLRSLPPAYSDENNQEFIKLTVRYSNGRPYYSIIYLEYDKNGVGHDFEGYSSYSLDVISDYLKKYFMPSAQPEPPWILCSEKMPEEYGNYLISIHGEDEPDIGTINPNDKRGWSLCDANGFHWASDKKLIVTAWMPLPEPYRKGAIK